MPSGAPRNPQITQQRRPAPLWQQLALGGSSCGLATSVTHPIDTIKLRLQLQGSFSTEPAARFTGLFSGLATITRDEGFFSLYKGLSPAILRAATYSATRLGLYEPLRSAFTQGAGLSEPNFPVKVFAAVCSGATGAVVGNPCELIKVRMQQGGIHRYRNVFHGIYRIAKDDGVASLWIGTGPAAMRAALLTSSQLATYDQSKQMLKRVTGIQEGLLAHFGAAMTAGLVTTTVSTPADVVKSVVMSSKPQVEVRKCVEHIYRNEGVRGFMRGWTANYARLGPHTLLTVIAYENLRTAVGWSNL